MLTETTLLPCPFSGTNNVILVCNGPTREQVQHAISWAQDYDVSFFVQCDYCGATSQETNEEAILLKVGTRGQHDKNHEEIGGSSSDSTGFTTYADFPIAFDSAHAASSRKSPDCNNALSTQPQFRHPPKAHLIYLFAPSRRCSLGSR
jgi:hypothetical protein